MVALLYIIGFVVICALCGGALFAMGIGASALERSRKAQGEHARTLRFVAINLCEPFANFFIVLVAVIILANTVASEFGSPSPTILIATLPMAVLLVPLRGINFQDQLCRETSRFLVGLGLARWLLVAVILQSEWYSIFAFIVGLGLLWWSVFEGKRRMELVVAAVRSAQRVSVSATVAPSGPARPRSQAARTTNAPQPVPVSGRGAPAPAPDYSQPTPRDIEQGRAIPCPVCHTFSGRYDPECLGCGLIFQSRIPARLQTLPGYQVLRPLGSGGMSSIYLARRRSSDRLCVVKTLASVDQLADAQWRIEATRCLRQEADLLRQLNHPNIAQMIDWLSVDQGEFLVLDYIPGLNLEHWVSRVDGQGAIIPGKLLPMTDVLRYGCSVAEMIQYLSGLPRPVVHHDIKPANLIVRPVDRTLVLVDFGGAMLLPDGAVWTARLDSYGTPGYAAPEQYRGESSTRSDIYGLAATLYHLLTDDDPTSHPLRFPKLETLPPAVVAALKPALDQEPAARPDARQFRATLLQARRHVPAGQDVAGWWWNNVFLQK